MKNWWIVLLLVIIIFSSGCASLPFGTGNKQVTGKGVGARFLQGNPSLSSLSEGLDFRVGVELTNNGISPVSGELCIFDSKFSTYGGIKEKECKSFSLGGAVDTGEQLPNKETVYFPNRDGSGYVYSGIEGENENTEITAEITYDYRVVASPQISICGNERECSFNEVISGGRLGADASRAPVTVTSVSKQIIPGATTAGIILDINIANTGSGMIIGNEDRQQVDFNVMLLGSGASFDCKPSNNGVILLEKGNKVIRCQSTIDLESGRIDGQLEIELGYSYKSEIMTGKIKIEDSD